MTSGATHNLERDPLRAMPPACSTEGMDSLIISAYILIACSLATTVYLRLTASKAGNNNKPPLPSEALSRRLHRLDSIHLFSPILLCLVTAICFMERHKTEDLIVGMVCAMIVFPISFSQYRRARKATADNMRQYRELLQNAKPGQP